MKRFLLISSFGLFLFSFLIHFIYEWFPNNIFAIFFPVNESIWEHMKMIATTILLFSLFIRILPTFHPSLFGAAVSIILGILLYLIFYLPFESIFGDQMWYAIGLLYFIFLLCSYLQYRIYYPTLYLPALIFCILFYIGCGYLTYDPPKEPLFYDEKEQIYGLQIHQI